MNLFVASFLFIALLALAMAHFFWSIGRTWPVTNEKLLAQTLIGTAGVERMPSRWRTLGVAVLMTIAAIAAAALADPLSGGVPLDVLGIAFAALFLWRGAKSFTPAFIASTPEAGFRDNDRRVYGPLCLGVGVGFIVLVILRVL